MITYHEQLVQGSDEWLAMRCGLLTASEMHKILTSTYKVAANEKVRAHVYELAAQRISKYVEPSYISEDMLRGHYDEIVARNLYSENYFPVVESGFITNDKWGFTIGYSPDGLVGDDGLIECKSKKQKLHVEIITENKIPPEHIVQLQTGLLVSERKWIDFISFCGGLPMYINRMYPDEEIQKTIVDAAGEFEKNVQYIIDMYEEKSDGFIETERDNGLEIVV